MPLWFWNVTALVKDKLWVQGGVAAVGWRSRLLQSCAVHWRRQEWLWLWGFWPSDSLYFTRKGSKDWAADVNSGPRWLDPNKRGRHPGRGPSSHLRHNLYWASYEPGQLLNPIQPALRNLGPGNKGSGGGNGLGEVKLGWLKVKVKKTRLMKPGSLVITSKCAPGMWGELCSNFFFPPLNQWTDLLLRNMSWNFLFHEAVRGSRGRRRSLVNTTPLFVHMELQGCGLEGLSNKNEL